MNIKVGVRVRPFSAKELMSSSQLCLQMSENSLKLYNKENQDETKEYVFDYCFWSHSGFAKNSQGIYEADCPKYAGQETVFEKLCIELLDSAWKGKNSCLYTYGETGAGKTFTLNGDLTNKGLIQLTCQQIFKRAEADRRMDRIYQICLEVYMIVNQSIEDLLIKDFFNQKRNPRLRIRQHRIRGLYIQDLTKIKVHSFQQMESHIEQSHRVKSIFCTHRGMDSRRITQIVNISIRRFERGKQQFYEQRSTMTFVDLAGSEKLSKTTIVNSQRNYGSYYQKLQCLGVVIHALTNQGRVRHVPYRDSCLTRILQHSLGGNCCTVFLALVSPAFSNYEETLSTLRYVSRCRNVVNKPTVNLIQVRNQLTQLCRERERLTQNLRILDSLNTQQIQEEEFLKQKTKILANLSVTNFQIESFQVVAPLLEIQSESIKQQQIQNTDKLEKKPKQPKPPNKSIQKTSEGTVHPQV